MGGCQPGIQNHHEIPFLLSDGTGRTWRNPFHGICGTRPDTRILAARCCIWRPTPAARSLQNPSVRAAEGHPSVDWLSPERVRTSRANVVCDALLLDPKSRSDTYPPLKSIRRSCTIGHEASVSKIGEEQLFYLKSRGLIRRGSDHHGGIRFY